MIFKLPKLIGHRGVKDLAPENTIFSIESAIKHQLKWIEVDVKTTKDNIPFLLHDDLLDRTTSGKGFPYEYTYKEISSFDAGSWFDKKFINAHTPSLKEALNICSKNRVGLNIELKPNKGKEKENVDSVSSLINNNIFNCQYFFSSFCYDSLELLKKKISNVHIGYLVDNIEKNKNILSIIKKCLKLKCFSIGFNLKLIDQELVQICKKNELNITVFSDRNVSLKEALFLWKIGIDSIFIDNPIPYKEILDN